MDLHFPPPPRIRATHPTKNHEPHAARTQGVLNLLLERSRLSVTLSIYPDKWRVPTTQLQKLVMLEGPLYMCLMLGTPLPHCTGTDDPWQTCPFLYLDSISPGSLGNWKSQEMKDLSRVRRTLPRYLLSKLLPKDLFLFLLIPELTLRAPFPFHYFLKKTSHRVELKGRLLMMKSQMFLQLLPVTMATT